MCADSPHIQSRFYVERYSDEAVTISIDALIHTNNAFIVDQRVKLPFVPKFQGSFSEEISELLALGADYIDVGYHAFWVAAEFPKNISLTPELVAKVVILLERIRVQC